MTDVIHPLDCCFPHDPFTQVSSPWLVAAPPGRNSGTRQIRRLAWRPTPPGSWDPRWADLRIRLPETKTARRVRLACLGFVGCGNTPVLGIRLK